VRLRKNVGEICVIGLALSSLTYSHFSFFSLFPPVSLSLFYDRGRDGTGLPFERFLSVERSVAGRTAEPVD
jgi:hypothetical protein